MGQAPLVMQVCRVGCKAGPLCYPQHALLPASSLHLWEPLLQKQCVSGSVQQLATPLRCLCDISLLSSLPAEHPSCSKNVALKSF